MLAAHKMLIESTRQASCRAEQVMSSLLSRLSMSMCRSTGEYAVSFEVWHEKLIEDAEEYFEQKQEEVS